jgi:tetratricopeptide (TPR) repeat protein
MPAFHHLGICVYFVFSIGLSTPVLADEKKRPEEIAKHMAEGNAAHQKRVFPDAVKSYEAARTIAHEKGHPALEGEAYLHLGEATLAWSLSGGADKKKSLQTKAESHFQSAIELGDDKVRLLAQNSLGVLYLSEAKESKEKAEKAVKIFSQMNLDKVPLKPSERAVYICNFGRALELSGKQDEAYKRYKDAIEVESLYQPPIERGFRLLFEKPDVERADEALRLANYLFSRGQSKTAVQQISANVERWPPDRIFSFLAVIMRYYSKVSVSPEDYQRVKREELLDLVKRNRLLKGPVNEIDIVFTGDFGTTFEPNQTRATFPSLAKDNDARPALITLLKMTADYYYREAGKNDQNSKMALARYVAAWNLNRKKTDCAVFAAAVLRDYPEVDANRQIYKEFIDSLMDEKGSRYRENPETAEDWDNLLRLHFLLGSLFEKDKAWGPEYEVRSATFQFGRAVKAEKELQRLRPDSRPSPNLHVHLGDAFQEIKQPKKAWDQYLVAAEGYIKLKDPDAAKKMLQKAKELGLDLGAEEKTRVKGIEETQLTLPKPALRD